MAWSRHESAKQPVIVDNRPGASANISMELVAKAMPDGYTLLMASNGIATNMALFPDLAFDAARDFAPIAKIGYAPLVIVVPAARSGTEHAGAIDAARYCGEIRPHLIISSNPSPASNGRLPDPAAASPSPLHPWSSTSSTDRPR
jgi:tripartite-type tricarboxylate transporter receptor subunit TctC